MWLSGWEPLTVSQHSVKFGDHRHCGNGGIMFLVVGEQDFTCLFNFTSTIFFLKYMTCNAHTYVMHNRDTLNENIWQCVRWKKLVPRCATNDGTYGKKFLPLLQKKQWQEVITIITIITIIFVLHAKTINTNKVLGIKVLSEKVISRTSILWTFR